MRNLSVMEYTADPSAFAETRVARAGPAVVLTRVALRVTKPLSTSSKSRISLLELL